MKNRWSVGILFAAGLTLAVVLLFSPKGEPLVPKSVAAAVKLANREVSVSGFPDGGSTNQQLTVRGTLPYVVRCAEHIDRSSRLAVEATGARVVGCLPPDAFQVEADGEMLRRISADPRFAGAAELLPGDKVDARLSEMLEGGAEAVVASVVALGPEDREGLREYVVSRGGELLKGCLNGNDSFRARLPAALVGELAQRGEVRWMEPFSRPKLMNDRVVEPAAMNMREVWDLHGLSGSNQVVSTSDSGVDFTHRDLDFAQQFAGLGVVKNCCSNDYIGHGTHTAGSIVGKGTMSDGQIRGVAWGAKLWAWFCLEKFENPEDAGNILTPETCDELFRPEHEKWPTFIHSASWGDTTTKSRSKYTSYSREIDQFVWEHPDFLPVFACGNAGSGARTASAEATAKNVLAVGATQSTRSGPFGDKFNKYQSGDPTQTATYSSRGPSLDGRIKPDLAAPGTGILSTRAANWAYDGGDYPANTNYAFQNGTSMATPLTAGAVALVREWLVDRCGFRGEPPTAALMKAVITGGAKGVSKPNNEQGWGRVDLAETLFPSNRAVRLIDRIPFAAGTNFSYVVRTTDTAPLDVQLVWIDYPGNDAAADSDPKLVNDLDLTVEPLENGAGTVWYGNGGTAADRINTTESVRIGTAPAGAYKVTVACRSVTYDHTEGGAAALYIRGALEKEMVKVSVAIETNGEYTEDPSPAVGETNVVCGTRMDFSAPEWSYDLSPLGTTCSRRAFVGFEGTGSVPASGTSRQFSVIVTNDTSVTWKYAPEVEDYLVSYYAFFDGVRSYYVRQMWCKNGLQFTPANLPGGMGLGDPYLYTGWYEPSDGSDPVYGTHEFRLGDIWYLQTDSEYGDPQLDDKGRLCDSVVITVDEGIDLFFDYYNSSETYNGLPYWWYMRYLWGGEKVYELGYDVSVKGDPDGDGFDNLAESGDLTDPLNDESFRFTIDAFTKTEMTFTGSVKGNFVVESCERLGDEWKGVQTLGSPRSSTVNRIRIEDSDGSNRFYRVIHQNN